GMAPPSQEGMPTLLARRDDSLRPIIRIPAGMLTRAAGRPLLYRRGPASLCHAPPISGTEPESVLVCGTQHALDSGSVPRLTGGDSAQQAKAACKHHVAMRDGLVRTQR